jgi:hypothetical protein
VAQAGWWGDGRGWGGGGGGGCCHNILFCLKMQICSRSFNYPQRISLIRKWRRTRRLPFLFTQIINKAAHFAHLTDTQQQFEQETEKWAAFAYVRTALAWRLSTAIVGFFADSLLEGPCLNSGAGVHYPNWRCMKNPSVPGRKFYSMIVSSHNLPQFIIPEYRANQIANLPLSSIPTPLGCKMQWRYDASHS